MSKSDKNTALGPSPNLSARARPPRHRFRSHSSSTSTQSAPRRCGDTHLGEHSLTVKRFLRRNDSFFSIPRHSAPKRPLTGIPTRQPAASVDPTTQRAIKLHQIARTAQPRRHQLLLRRISRPLRVQRHQKRINSRTISRLRYGWRESQQSARWIVLVAIALGSVSEGGQGDLELLQSYRLETALGERVGLS